MTFCLGMRVNEGLVGIADTRVTSGNEVILARDVVLYRRDTFERVEHRYAANELGDISDWWDDQLRRSIQELPSEWIDQAFAGLQPQAR